ncbi:ribosome biogenesis GTPase YlqF [Proteinivorax hydrogeniformans]|uniref:Ribosome biogenesis GTPase A n=1 Tax=Proteinivorax hydrogeniformans TaxID=1826727 RepID=A0AAU8HQZ0_9FIRM
MQYQWYPGHMVKTKALIKENLKLCDVIVELVDGRIPLSSRNPDINEIVKDKPKVIALTKSDLADPTKTNIWLEYFKDMNTDAIAVNLNSQNQWKKVIELAKKKAVSKSKYKKLNIKINKPTRAMVLGIPNVGKSTFINKVASRAAAKTGDKPGVTKQKQWIRTKDKIELMDTPGVLWPKFDDDEVGFRLAVTGAIKDEIVNVEDMARRLIKVLIRDYQSDLSKRYDIDMSLGPDHFIEQAAINRRILLPQGHPDLAKISEILVREFRKGLLGNVTLDNISEVD